MVNSSCVLISANSFGVSILKSLCPHEIYSPATKKQPMANNKNKIPKKRSFDHQNFLKNKQIIEENSNKKN